MARASSATPAFELTGGRTCLDFVNTVDSRPLRARHDRLQAYDDLVAWTTQAGLLSKPTAGRLSRMAARRPSDAAAVLRRMVALREALYRIFSQAALTKPPRAADLATLNGALSTALARSHLSPARGGFVWKGAHALSDLDPMLWPVARSALDLLTSPDLGRVRECAADTCGWLFLDTSRNRTRRWCNMKVCGNRDKVRRFRERHV